MAPRNVFDNSKDHQDVVTIPLKSGEMTVGTIEFAEDGTFEGSIKLQEYTGNLFALVKNGIAIYAEPAHETPSSDRLFGEYNDFKQRRVG